MENDMRAMSILVYVTVLAMATPLALAQANDPRIDALHADIAAGKHDEIVGSYQVGFTVLSVTREGKQIFAQAGENAPFMELHPQPKGGYTVMDGRAQVTFSKDAAGRVTALRLKQGSAEQVAQRISEQQAAQIKADIAKRVAENKPAPGVEGMLRKHIEALRAGNPLYDMMSPDLAAAIKAQAQMSQARLAEVGAIQSIEFTGVTANGLDTFLVKYEKGASRYVIGLGGDGKVASMAVRLE
jgi:hypothetical protein